MYVLYGCPFSRSLIVEMVLAEGGIGYEVRSVDIIWQEHRSVEYLAVNPNGLVPALLTPHGDTLYETPAICLYLAEHHDLTDLAPHCKEPERGAFLSGLFHLCSELEPLAKQYFYPHRYGLSGDDAPAMKEMALAKFDKHLAIIEGRLAAGGPFHLGTRFSLVDIILAFWVTYVDNPNRTKSFPAVNRCVKLTMERPKLCDHFDQLLSWKQQYAKMQSQGGGVA